MSKGDCFDTFWPITFDTFWSITLLNTELKFLDKVSKNVGACHGWSDRGSTEMCRSQQKHSEKLHFLRYTSEGFESKSGKGEEMFHLD